MTVTVKHRASVVVRHPLTDQYVSMAYGQELADDDPFVSDERFSWLFAEDDTPASVESVEIAPASKRARKA